MKGLLVSNRRTGIACDPLRAGIGVWEFVRELF